MQNDDVEMCGVVRVVQHHDQGLIPNMKNRLRSGRKRLPPPGAVLEAPSEIQLDAVLELAGAGQVHAAPAEIASREIVSGAQYLVRQAEGTGRREEEQGGQARKRAIEVTIGQ
eukprot:1011954-Pleurochrysis_carterae.AAC.2